MKQVPAVRNRATPAAGGSVRLPEPRSAFAESVPAWPAGLIGPSTAEVLRWFELWGGPQAAVWARTGSEGDVADLVRLELRCRQPLPAGDHLARLENLQRVLGLTAD